MHELTTFFAVFCGALATALLLTPMIAEWARKKGICDHPSSRRIHAQCMPRAGGIALLLSFLVAYLIVYPMAKGGDFSSLLQKDQLFFLLGACLIFLLGLADDISSIPPVFKLLGQIMVGLLVWTGGIRVDLLSVTLHKGVVLPVGLSFCITIFWVVLLINAINLIDGLDGLAAGICLFVSLTLLTLCLSSVNPMVPVGLSALAGACLGFLRYNFNPAMIFMGDSGSYLLGYLLAVLTIQGAMKSQATVALLIPIIALGVPLLDTLLAPIRRFVLGKKMFTADQGHIHHLLLRLGYSQRRVVVIIYGITVLLGLTCLAFVFVKDQRAAFILILPGILCFLVIKKLGYLEYIAADKVWGWLRDITDEVGLSAERRTFLNIQMQILRSEDLDQLWDNIGLALEKLDFDMAELLLDEEVVLNGGRDFHWRRQGTAERYELTDCCQFKLEMPLMADSKRSYGILWLIKDLRRGNFSHYTLRRVEHLRRTIIGVLEKLISR